MTLRLKSGQREWNLPGPQVRVGTAGDNELCVPHDLRLQPYHAVFRSHGGRWLIEATANIPLKVGDGRPALFAWLQPGDLIQLTDAGPTIEFEPPVETATDAVPKGQRSLGWKPLTATVFALLVLVSSGWLVRSENTSPAKPKELPSPAGPPVPVVSATVGPIDPREHLTLIAIGDLASDQRPHVLGVGLFWDAGRVIVTRELGNTLAELLKQCRERGLSREGCVIQGVSLPVTSIDEVEVIPQISVLTLGSPAVLSGSLPLSSRPVTAIDVERLRGKKTPLRSVSFAPFPRGENVPVSEPPLHAYDPETIDYLDQPATLLYEQRHHHLVTSSDAPRAERGGLLVDIDGRVLGMTLSDSSILWTADFLPALQVWDR